MYIYKALYWLPTRSRNFYAILNKIFFVVFKLTLKKAYPFVLNLSPPY